MGYGAVPRQFGRRPGRSSGRPVRGECRGAGRPLDMAMITDATLATGLESEAEAEGLAFAREVIRIEARALERVGAQLGRSLSRAADLIQCCPGSTIVTGMGKAGLVGQKLAATLASTGTRAFPLHPA